MRHRLKHVARSAALGVAVLAGGAVATVAGCSSGPKVSGVSFGAARFVGVGKTLTVRLPLGPGGAREWRVSSFDSSFLTVIERHIEGAGDNAELVITARTRLPGTTELEFIEVLSPEQEARGAQPRTRTFKVEIVP